MGIFLTSYNHFYHRNVLELSKRPFGSLEEMHEGMISNWNKVVRSEDTIYVIGDMFLTKSGKATTRERVDSVLDRLKGKIHIIPGNHDWHIWKIAYKSDGIYETAGCKTSVIILDQLTEITINEQLLVLCHYPMKSWNKKHYGSIHLHGHTHGMGGTYDKNAIDVGVDCWDYTPVSIDQILNHV